MTFEIFKYLIDKRLEFSTNIENLKNLILTERGFQPNSSGWQEMSYIIDCHISGKEYRIRDKTRLNGISPTLLNRMNEYYRQLKIINDKLPNEKEIERLLTVDANLYNEELSKYFTSIGFEYKCDPSNFYDLEISIKKGNISRNYNIDARQYWYYNKFGESDYTYGVMISGKLIKGIGFDYPKTIEIFWTLIHNRERNYYANLIKKCTEEIQKKRKALRDLEDPKVIQEKKLVLRKEIEDLERTVNEKYNSHDWK